MASLKANGNFGSPPHLIACEVIDRDGRTHGPFQGLAEANAFVRSRFPNQEQDPDRTGKGWGRTNSGLRVMPKLKMTVLERLMSKIDRTSGGCWNWIAGKDSYGYGQMRVDGRKRLAHRISYEADNGAIPSGQCVLHRCDNPACINPEHLFLGTQPENIADMIAKGRDRKARLKGVDSSQAKLTETDVIAIRTATGLSHSALAARYGVSPSQIGNIRRGKHWSHVQVSGCDDLR